MKMIYYPYGVFHENRSVWVYRGTLGTPLYMRSVYYDAVEGRWVIASGGQGIVATFKTLRSAKRSANRDAKINENRRRRQGTVIRAHAWRDRLKLWPSDRKVRHALKKPALRRVWRDTAFPLCFEVDDIERRLGVEGAAEMWAWLTERGLMNRFRNDIIFAYRRTGRQRRPRVVTTDMIDFPDDNSRFEFRMRWL